MPLLDYYVYALVDPRDGAFFYIGKGRKHRCHQHVKDVRRGQCNNALKGERIEAIISAGFDVRVEFLHKDLSDAEAMRLERVAIKEHKAALTNLKMGQRHQLESALARVNDLIRRFRTPIQWVVAIVDWRGRLPTKQERDWYEESWQWHLDMRDHLCRLLAESRYLETVVEIKRG